MTKNDGLIMLNAFASPLIVNPLQASYLGKHRTYCLGRLVSWGSNILHLPMCK